MSYNYRNIVLLFLQYTSLRMDMQLKLAQVIRLTPLSLTTTLLLGVCLKSGTSIYMFSFFSALVIINILMYFLRCSPASELVFTMSQPAKDVIIKLTCVSAKPISYKVIGDFLFVFYEFFICVTLLQIRFLLLGEN